MTQNIASQNSGGQNSGGQNIGDQNIGGQNSGDQNIGDQNTGGQDSGGQNTGARLVLVDGSGYIFRAFHGLPMMTKADGTPINAVFGFTKMMLKLRADLNPSHILVLFDAGRVTFRNDIYADYKANRTEAPEELIPQFPLVREAARALGFQIAEKDGFEADDLIASYAQQAKNENMDCLIISSDKDLMQLVQPGVTMLDPMKNKPIAEEQVLAKFGVTPNLVVDVQALAGDASDNVPGVPGIGVKTAAELINQFGGLEEVLNEAEKIKQPKRRESLMTYAEQARLSQKLVQLKNDVPLPYPIEELRTTPPDHESMMAFLHEQNFKSLIASIGGDDKAAADRAALLSGADKPDYELITEETVLDEWIDLARKQGFVAIDTETSSLDGRSAILVGVAMSLAPGKAGYMPLRHVHPVQDTAENTTQNSAQNSDKHNQAGLDFTGPPLTQKTSEAGEVGHEKTVPPPPPPPAPIKQIPLEVALPKLKTLVEDVSILKIGHNLKYDALVVLNPENGGFRFASVEDTMCLSYVLDAGRVERHGLDYLAAHWLGIETIKYEQICGKGAKQIPFAHVPPEMACRYAAEDADVTLRLWQQLKPRLRQEGMAIVYERLERPLINILADMEYAGIAINAEILRRLSNEFASQIAELEKQIHSLAGKIFNIASPKQLGEVLFDHLKLEGGKKSKTGAWSTSAAILEDMAAQDIIIAKTVLDYRQLAKLKSTYTDALVKSINPKDKRVHTSFSMVGASTGRLSSSDPNLQNIPIRTAEGRQIRDAFIAQPGYKLISADYSQIELRLIAHIAHEKAMLHAFMEGVDIHAQTAAEMFNTPLNVMNAETRRRAKAINFGIIYGISPFGLARQLSIPQTEARNYIDAYFQKFPGIRDYMEEVKDFARTHYFVKTLFGRHIHIPQIKDKNMAMRNFAERQAINAPIQGSAADIIKRAMIQLPDRLKAEKLDTRMLLQVHDELIFESPEAETEHAVAIIKQVMEQACEPVMTLNVPLIVEAGIADSWAEAH